MKTHLQRLIFTILALAFLALGWTTYAVLHLEKDEHRTALWAKHDNDIRKALSAVNSFMFRFTETENSRTWLEKNAEGKIVLHPLQSKPDFVRAYFCLTPQSELLRFNEEKTPTTDAISAPPASTPQSPTSKEGLAEAEALFPTPPQSGHIHPLVHETPFLPHWQGNDLIFLKQVPTPQGNYTFAIWVDWPLLKSRLLSEIRNILPQAEIETYRMQNEGDPLLSLATLPARLSPGALPDEKMPIFSPLRIGLLLAWALILAGAGGLVALLSGTARLSERRAAFVSAVTHELRTPLTNFSLYTEMLDEGLVPEDSKPGYFRLLRAESTRLIHLVENVLAYARVEKRDNDHHQEHFFSEDLFDSLARRIKSRLASENTDFRYRLDKSAKGLSLSTDKTAIEQIIDNLVDNSLKYGTAEKPEISLEVSHEKKTFSLHFRDNGPGIPASQEKDLFAPFTRSAEAAAGHKPGVGLGLALARDTARMLKGELSLSHDKSEKGVHFVLTLPSR